MARLFILRPKQVTMPSIGVLPSNYTTLRCMHYAELFLQSHGLPNWNESRWSTVSSASPLTSQESQSMLHYFFSLTPYLTRITVDAALFLQPHRLPHKNHSRCCTISSASPLTSQESQSMLHYFFSFTAYLMMHILYRKQSNWYGILLVVID